MLLINAANPIYVLIEIVSVGFTRIVVTVHLYKTINANHLVSSFQRHLIHVRA